MRPLKDVVRQIGLRAGIEVRRIDDPKLMHTVSLKPPREGRGDVLISYNLKPFLPGGERLIDTHSAFWESVQIARTFLDLGYCVDVVHWENHRFRPTKEYAVFVDTHANLGRIGPSLNKDCVKILHIVWAHWLFHNQAELKRLLFVKERRGVMLKPMRQLEPAWSIEAADYATMLGNGFTHSTYAYAGKPVFRIPISTQALYPSPEEKDFDACRRRFLWFGGVGLAHKGLDLVLEAFAGMPGYHLMVCGQVSYERDFERAYHKELYETPNIKVVGWMDVRSTEFLEITRRCVGLIHPSCSEGQSGSVVNCLHAGLIPIVSRESGVDLEESFGFVLSDCSVEEIKRRVRQVSDLPGETLRAMAREAWRYARENHTKRRFSEEYAKAVGTILEGCGQVPHSEERSEN